MSNTTIPKPTTQRGNPALERKIASMRLTLAPIYPLLTGPPHPYYPRILLQFWLLTEDQLDSMARYYHQLSPSNPWRTLYPVTMNWDPAFLARPDSTTMSREEMSALPSDEDRVMIKRRLFGKFIGFRGCDTPIEEVERKVKFFEGRLERSIMKERDMMGTKYMNPFSQ